MFFFNYKYYLVFLLIFYYSYSQTLTIHLSTIGTDTVFKSNYFFDSTYNINKILVQKGFFLDTIISYKKSNDTLYLKANNIITIRYNSKIFDDFYKQILFLQTEGYPLANFTLDSLQYSQSFSSLHLNTYYNIKNIKKYRISKIEIHGLKSTTNNTIYKIIDIHPFDYFNYSKINNIQNTLKNFNFLSLTRPPLIILDTSGNTFINLFFNEAKSTFFDCLLGFSQTKKNNLDFFGKLNLSINNLFGTARKFFFEWNKPKKNFFDLSIEYKEPWTFGYNLSTYLKISQNKYDTLFINNRYTILFEYHINNYFSFGYGINYENSIPNPNVNLTSYPKYINYSHSFTSKFMNLDNNLIPKKGYLISLSAISIIKDNLIEKKKFNQQSLIFEFVYTQNLFSNMYYYTKFLSKSKFGKNITTNDFFYIGGFKSLRGYDEYQFVGNIINLINNELRLFTNTDSYFFILYDISIVQKYKTILPNTKDILSSYGAGTVFSTRNGIFSVTLSMPQNHNFNNLKIHFGYINNF